MLCVTSLKRPGLGPIDFSVSSGACLAIIGPSGAGKSLLLRAIADLDISSGQVKTDKMHQNQVSAPVWRQHVAMVPAETGWWDDGVAAHFTHPQDMAEQLVALGLPAKAMDWEVSRLSTGERQRLALLRALNPRPSVLLLDEPTAALDQKTALLVEALLKSLLKTGMTIVIVTHDAAQPARLGAKVATLENGLLKVPA